MDAWTEAIADAKQPDATNIAVQGWHLAHLLIGKSTSVMAYAKRVDWPDIDWDSDILIRQILDQPVGDWVTRTSRIETETTARQLESIYRRVAMDGETPGAIASAFLQQGSAAIESRAMLMARTMTIWAANEGSMRAYEAEGIEEHEWLVTIDDVTCEFCRPMDGRPVRVSESWYAEGTEIMGDEGGFMTTIFDVQHPPLHPHCRCTTVPVSPLGFDE